MSDLIRRMRERRDQRTASPQQGGEQEFQKWYAGWAAKTGIDPNPDHPDHRYDYRSAWRAGASPSLDRQSGEYHWPSQFKAADHPNRYVEGIDTITGRPMRGDYQPRIMR